jgi:hypothetical protein
LDYQPFVQPEQVPRLSKADCRLSLANYPPFLEGLVGMWAPLSRQPFQGITTDGQVLPGLYSLQPCAAPVEQAVNAATAWLASLDAPTRAKVCLPVTADEWRHWQNTPLILRDTQVEMEQLNERQRALALDLVKVSLSEQGYARTQRVMDCNAFLGEINGLQAIMNRWSYTLTLFGTPSTTEPWGWQFFGHHLALNCFFVGAQMVLTPVFMGMEPDIDQGAQRRVFEPHEQAALALMRSLSQTEVRQAVLYDSMLVANQPPGRFHPDDGRQVGGAFQDNRVVPYEGVRVGALGIDQRRRILEIADLFINNLPTGPAAARLSEIEKHIKDSHFAWIGQVNDIDPFYFRIHSPVALMEFDHHSGIFLANKEPARFHVHAIVRTPNGNDYGADLLRQHYARGGHDRGPAMSQGVSAAGAHSHDGGKTFHHHD